jgi:hypothetical protein
MTRSIASIQREGACSRYPGGSPSIHEWDTEASAGVSAESRSSTIALVPAGAISIPMNCMCLRLYRMMWIDKPGETKLRR